MMHAARQILADILQESTDESRQERLGGKLDGGPDLRIYAVMVYEVQ